MFDDGFDIGFEFTIDVNLIDSKECSLNTSPTDHPEFLDLFFTAVRLGKYYLLKELLTVPMRNIDVLDKQGTTAGMTALGIAAQNGYSEIATLLLENNANVNAEDKEGRTPLLIASKTDTPKSLQVAKLLLNHHADTELADNDHNTPLSWAIYRCSYPMLSTLLEHKADPNKIIQTGRCKGLTPLASVMCTQYQWMLELFCQHVEKIDSQALLQAVKYARRDYIKIMWPNLSFDSKAQVILNAIEFNQMNILEYALANVTADERKLVLNTLIKGVTPLTYCFDHHRLRCAKMLLDYNVELVSKDTAYSKDSITLKFATKDWRNMLETYFDRLKRNEETLTLTEMTANKVYKIANSTNTPLESLGIHDELQTLCRNAPLRLHTQSELKPRHVRDFLSDLLTKPTTDIAELKKQIKRKRSNQLDKPKKRATRK